MAFGDGQVDHGEQAEEEAAAREAAEKRAAEAQAKAAARAPRKLRLNVTSTSPGYVHASIFQSDNGVNWACSASGLVFDEDWWRAIFGEPAEGRRIEFDIANPHEVTD